MDMRCSVLINSCDKNSDLWPLFFHYFKKNYNDCEFPIYLNTEYGTYSDEKLKINCLKLFPYGDKNRWSFRLRKHLEAMDTEYVLLLLDDFFLTEKTDSSSINKCIERMAEDKNIANFIFESGRHMCHESEYPEYLIQDRKAPFRLSLQAGIWRRSVLLKYLRNHEGPWQFETWGSRRARRWKEKSFVLKTNQPKVFSYYSGGMIADNRWRGDEAYQLLIADGLDVDFQIRGIYYDGDPRKTEVVVRTKLKKAFDVFRSLI